MLLYFQLHFPNLSPIVILVYFHESSPAVPSIPVVFQDSRVLVLYSSNTMHYIPVCYSSKPASNIPVIVPFVFQSCHLLFNSSIPLTVSLIPLFLFQYPNVSFSQFLSCLLLCFSFQYCSPYYFRTRSMLRLLSVSRFSIVFHYHATYLNFFAVSSLCLRRHLWHWTRNPWIDSPPATFRRSLRALPACRHNFVYYTNIASLSTQLYSSQNSNP